MSAAPARAAAPGAGSSSLPPSDILSRLNATVARDRAAGAVQPWMVRWLYQDQREDRYQEGLPQEFYDFAGPEQLAEWFRWSGSTPKPSSLAAELVQPLMDVSIAKDRAIAERIGIDLPGAHVRQVALSNAQDWIFSRCDMASPPPQALRVLDFGAGFGRQANLFSQIPGPATYVAMDAIPYSYCLQNLYLGQLGPEFHEYVAQPDGFRIESRPGLYHLPTWRHDLLPAGFFDLVLCVQVLHEISRELSEFMIGVFGRVLKPGGGLYVRDHGDGFNPVGADLDPVLRQAGFELRFQPPLRDGTDIHGVPRIWRKAAESVLRA